MSTVTSELSDSYTKIVDGEFYKNLKGITAGIEALQKSFVGSESRKQMQSWQTVLNDPESSINKSMRMWSEISKNIDYGKSVGLQQFVDRISKIDVISSAGLQLPLSELLTTKNVISFKVSEAIDYAYEKAKEEAGEPEISKEELGNVVRKEIINNTLGGADIKNNIFKEKFYAIIKFLLISVILPLVVSFVYDLGKAQLGKVIKFSTEDDSPVIYEIHNENTYVNIIDQTDKKYHIFFVDDDGNVIDGYTDKENIDMNFGDAED